MQMLIIALISLRLQMIVAVSLQWFAVTAMVNYGLIQKPNKIHCKSAINFSDMAQFEPRLNRV